MSNNLLQLVEEFRKLERRSKATDGKLSPADEERLAHLRDYLGKAINGTEPAAERRDNLRVPISIRARYRTGDIFANNYIDNLSSGGVFITTPKPLPLDTKVKLRLLFEDKDVEIEVEGKVVWENTQAGKLGDITKPGMGIKFLKIDREAQQVIDDIVHKALEEHARIEQERADEENKREESKKRVGGLLKKKK